VETQQERQIAGLEAHVAKLDAKLEKMQTDHIECVRLQASLEAKCTALSKQYEAAMDEVKSLREWRHEIANAMHSEALKKLVASAPNPEHPPNPSDSGIH